MTEYIWTDRFLVLMAKGWTLEALDPRYHSALLCREVLP